MNQDKKREYLMDLIKNIIKKDVVKQDDWNDALYVDDKHYSIYCTPACEQIFGGNDVPDDNNVGIGFEITDEDGIEVVNMEIDFVLTYDLDQDTANYINIITRG